MTQQTPAYTYAASANQIQAPLPAQNTGWAVAALLFFWPVSFSAFTHASRVYPLWAMGDYAGAQEASDKTKRLGKISLVLFLVLTVGLTTLYIAAMAAMISSGGTY